MEETECGAASLAMILAYYRCFLPLSEVRAACGVTRDGSRISDIIAAAGECGLSARAFHADARGAAAFPVPSILYWEFNHFLVLERVEGRRVVVNDPAVGRRHLSHAEFAARFSGIVLHLAPNEAFRATGKPASQTLEFARQMGKQRSSLALFFGFSLLMALSEVGVLRLIQLFTNQVLVRHVQGVAAGLLLVMIGATALQAGFGWLQSLTVARLKVLLVRQRTGELTRHMFSLPMGFFDQRRPANLVDRISGLEITTRTISVRASGVLANLVTAVVFSIFACVCDPELAAICLPLSYGAFAMALYVLRLRREAHYTMIRQYGKLRVAVLGTLQVLDSLKAMGLEAGMLQRFASLHAKTLNYRHRADIDDAVGVFLPWLLMAGTTVLALGVGAAQVMGGTLSLGALLAFLTLLAGLQAPLQGLLREMESLHLFGEAFERVEDVMTARPEVRGMGQRTPGMPRGRIEFRNVTFGYDKRKPPLLQDVSFNVEPGTQLALVGRTGCGKSTLAYLLAGLYQPWSGEILLDGVQVSAIDRAAFGRLVAMVDQQIHLFPGTIRENLSLWNADVSDQTLNAALGLAEAAPFLAARGGGLEALVAERARNFSGGQSQRLEIARALAVDPLVLIADEATSALDTVTEARVLENLRRRGKTCIFVAHRLSAFRDCDRIVFIRDGRVHESGSHEELAELGGGYAELVRAH